MSMPLTPLERDIRKSFERHARALFSTPREARAALEPHFRTGFKSGMAYRRNILKDRQVTLFDAIAHGDEQHRAWLKQAIEDHFAGRPVARLAPDNQVPLVRMTELGASPSEINIELIREQCEDGLIAEHDCPAVYALACILAEVTPEASKNTGESQS